MVIPVKWRKQVLTTRCKRLLLQILAIGITYCLFRLLSYRYQQGLSHKHGGRLTGEEKDASHQTGNVGAIGSVLDETNYGNPAARTIMPARQGDQTYLPVINSNGDRVLVSAREEQWRQGDRANVPVVNPTGDWVAVPQVVDPRAYAAFPPNAERRVVHETVYADGVPAKDEQRDRVFYDNDNLSVVRNAPDQDEGMGEVYRRNDLIQVGPVAERRDDVLIRSQYGEPIRFRNDERGAGYVRENLNQIRPPNVEFGRVYQGENVDPMRPADDEKRWVYPGENVNPARFQTEERDVDSIQSDNVNRLRPAPTENPMDYFLEYAKRLARSTGEDNGVAPIQENNGHAVRDAIKEKGLDYYIEYAKHPERLTGEEKGVAPTRNDASPVRAAIKEKGLDYYIEYVKHPERLTGKELGVVPGENSNANQMRPAANEKGLDYFLELAKPAERSAPKQGPSY